MPILTPAAPPPTDTHAAHDGRRRLFGPAGLAAVGAGAALLGAARTRGGRLAALAVLGAGAWGVSEGLRQRTLAAWSAAVERT